MAINPEIALQGRPVQFDATAPINLMNQGRQMQMQQQQLQMQQEAHAQQMQTGALALQEQQRQITEGQQYRDLFKPTPGPDGQPVVPNLRAVLPKVYAINPALGESMRKSLHEQEKGDLDMEKTRIETAAKQAELLGSIAGTITDEASFIRGIHTGLDQGLIKAGDAQKLLAEGWSPESQAYVQQIRQRALSAKEQHDANLADLENKRKAVDAQHEAELHPFKVQEAQSKAALANRQEDATTLAAAAKQGPESLAQAMAQLYMKDPKRFQSFKGLTAQAKPEDILRIGMTPHEISTADQAASTAAETANFHRQTVAQGRERIGLESQANKIRAAEADPYGLLGVNPNPAGGGAAANTRGEEFLATLPTTLAAKVKAVAEGRQPMPNARGGVLRGEGKAISDAVYQYDPDFSTQRADIRKAFTTGKQGDNIGALNTATVHLDQLSEVAKAMQNGSFRPGNELFNKVKTIFGNATPTNFEGLKSAVAGEMANALKGSATDIEIGNISKSLQAAGSPEQLAGIIKTHLHTLAAKLNTYQERYRQQSPNDKAYSPVLPAAKAVYEKYGIGQAPAAPGAAPEVTSQADYDKLSKGAKYTNNGVLHIKQ
jgi:hypothetical protein